VRDIRRFFRYSKKFMADDHKMQFQSQLWNIANTLRGKMVARQTKTDFSRCVAASLNLGSCIPGV
jgi:hypothetical protein